MQNKKVIALIVLSVLAVISLIYGITASPKSKSAASASAVVSKSAPEPVSSSAILTQRRARRGQFKAWKRNPFAPIGTASSSELVLNGIIWSKTRPKAMIGDAIVVKGDTVGANKVVDIRPDKVILNDGTKNFELKLEK